MLYTINNDPVVWYNVYNKAREDRTVYTMEEMKQAYDAYCAEMDYEGFVVYIIPHYWIIVNRLDC